MAIFLIVVFTVYFFTNFYIYLKGSRALAGAGYPTTIYMVIFLVLASTFIAGKFLEYRFTNVLTDILNIAGGFWMAFMLYGFLMWFLSDILLLVQRPFHLISVTSMPQVKLWLFLVITGVSAILITAGFFSAVSPRVTRYDISTEKSFADRQEGMTIVAVSDIHLGSIIRKRSMRHLSQMIKDEKPDLVLFLGDLIDGSIGPVLRGDLLSYLTLPPLKYGHYAITGNHEYMGNLNRSIPYIESKGIRVLKDEVITLDNGVQLVGRLDRTAQQGFGSGRATLDSLMKMTVEDRPVIILDHQPYELKSLEGSAIDLQLSGHTHNGQMWPLNLITRAMFELSYGHRKFGNTDVIVSSGFGIWGPRVRLGTRPEIVVISFTGKSQNVVDLLQHNTP
ncbi:MAG TPA: metallophosphoesterase [Bacteroidales bacterium]|nr:metallophosphoesterase [Bacteroidales bacterium]